MPHEVIMPALGMAQNTGQLVAWLKKAGDPVKAGDPIMEVETDKATMEVEAQADGFLTDLRAEEGTDVPVGDVVAMISETAEGSGTAPAKGDAAPKAAATAPAAADALPDGAKVIMPALGMAQDTGLLVGWLVAPGDKVGADDPLLEVETDKSTMEVPAGADGYLAAVLAAEGEDVPVGDVIAIVTKDKPDTPIVRSRAEGAPSPAPAAEAPAPAPANESDAPQPAAKGPAKTPAKAPATASGGRVLASPKARRLAAEEGLDLARLLEEGLTPPFHVADLDTLRALPAAAAATAAPQAAAQVAGGQRLTASVPARPFADFLAWLAKETKTPPAREAALAAFAAASLRTDEATLAVTVENTLAGQSDAYTDPDRQPMASVASSETPGAAAIVLRDLTGTAITSIQLGAEPAPVLSLSSDGEMITVTYEGSLAPDRAIALMNGFAGRLSDPLRHLL